MGSTRIALVKDLESVLVRRDLTRKKVLKITELIRKAKNGHYDDFQSSVPMPKITLHHDLVAIGGLEEIDQKVINGDYDE